MNALQPLLESGRYGRTAELEAADLVLDYERVPGAVTAEWVYVPVVAFASTAESLRWSDVQRYWAGEPEALLSLSTTTTPPTFVATPETLRAMTSLLGNPAPNLPLQLVADHPALVAALWEGRAAAWGILAFHDLDMQTKVLTLDRADVFSDAFVAEDYPLTTRLNLKGETEALGQAVDDLNALGTWQATNRNPERLTRLVLTGVTALSRATAFQMEQRGITVPADGIMPFIEDAHLLHTSNEVAFAENCPFPDPYGGVIFCSQDEYLGLLTHIGLDIVELTGNHVNDYGPAAFRRTLDIYAANNIATYGGGYTPEDARDAYLTTHQGNSLAFIGCNAVGPFTAWASETREGSAPCDEAFLEAEVARLAAEVDVVVLSFQEFEFYRYSVGLEQLRRFEKYAALGADVIIGSQAHQPQGFTFSSGAFLHHGLGNLFFDQMQNIGTRQMFIDKVIIYEGRVINVVLFTGLIEEFCCPRPMTAPERVDFLNTIFGASGW
ncbi:MAG: hypothetical protein HC915_09820 [Anaerolineae bacterium]|nr:hypothetical protein [Anaerolineae bacterium]